MEARARGTPVIAFGRGGSSETIRGFDERSPTGVLFEEQTTSSIAQAIRTLETQEARIRPDACRDNAARFSAPRLSAALAIAGRVRSMRHVCGQKFVDWRRRGSVLLLSDGSLKKSSHTANF